LILANEAEWVLVYSDPTAVVLARSAPGAAGGVPAALPRSAVYDNLRAIALRARAAGSRHVKMLPHWRKSLALALYAQGEPAAALTLLEDYLQLAQGDTDAAKVRDEIAREMGGASAVPNVRDGSPRRR
jgi:hypothetical protein